MYMYACDVEMFEESEPGGELTESQHSPVPPTPLDSVDEQGDLISMLTHTSIVSCI